jgi:hypothetical protein
MLAVYGALAAAVLLIGNRLGNLGNRTDLGARLRRLHFLALVAFLVGCGLAWMAYETDHPSKQRHMLLPVLFVMIVYGYPLVLELKAIALAWGAYVLQHLFRRP